MHQYLAQHAHAAGSTSASAEIEHFEADRRHRRRFHHLLDAICLRDAVVSDRQGFRSIRISRAHGCALYVRRLQLEHQSIHLRQVYETESHLRRKNDALCDAMTK